MWMCKWKWNVFERECVCVDILFLLFIVFIELLLDKKLQEELIQK